MHNAVTAWRGSRDCKTSAGVSRLWVLKKFPDGMQSQIIVTCCVLHKMCTSMKYQIPERLARDVCETDGQGGMEEKLE